MLCAKVPDAEKEVSAKKLSGGAGEEIVASPRRDAAAFTGKGLPAKSNRATEYRRNEK